MRIGLIGHATLTITHGDFFALMGPVLVDPFESGRNYFNPPVEIDVAYLRERAQVIIISHAHFDHFSPRSLALLDRRAMVLYPEGASIIEHALQRLGFDDVQPMRAWQTVEVGPMKLTPTPSEATFPELGILFHASDRAVWNLVDTDVDESMVGYLRAAYGSPDLLIAPYQPLIEDPLTEDSLGTAFPYDQYGRFLTRVWNIRPRAVVPGSFGYRFADPWLNQRGFPISASQFAADLKRVTPDLEILHLTPGGAVDVGEVIRLEPDTLLYAKRLDEPVALDWRPDKGVPPLTDRNPKGHTPDELRSTVAGFLDGELLPSLSLQVSWRERLARIGTLWRLEVIYPDGSIEMRALDFNRMPLAWAPPSASAFAKLHTSVTASGLVGILRGEISPYGFRFNDIRTVNRLYEVHRAGVSQAGDGDDDPLTLLLKDTLNRRYVDRELDEILGVSSS